MNQSKASRSEGVAARIFGSLITGLMYALAERPDEGCPQELNSAKRIGAL
jgi:hypothetical protein